MFYADIAANPTIIFSSHLSNNTNIVLGFCIGEKYQAKIMYVSRVLHLINQLNKVENPTLRFKEKK
jgi:hypothetical protein